MNPVNEAIRKQLAAQEREDARDDQTVYALAVLMVDIHVATSLKNKNMIANSFMKCGVLLRNNPGFVARFKKEQTEIINHIKAMIPGGRMELPPGVVAAAVQDSMQEPPTVTTPAPPESGAI